MNLEQVIVCTVFALVVYGIGFVRGMNAGIEIARGDK